LGGCRWEMGDGGDWLREVRVLEGGEGVSEDEEEEW
jgi:hypothetical protein